MQVRLLCSELSLREKRSARHWCKYPEVSLQQAISLVDSYQIMPSKGINPLEEKARIENIPKFADFFYKVYMPMAKLNKKS